MQKTRRRFAARGQGLAEFAIVFPVFMFILAGVIQFGVILWGQNTLNQVTRDTGRYAATLNCSSAASTAAQTTFGTLMTQAGGPWKNATGTVAYSSSTCPADNQTQVWVTVTGQFDAPIFFIWVPGNGHLTSTTEFRVEPKP
jgi:Flp pilus assembly protein TadG